jgi:hypothetical protein
MSLRTTFLSATFAILGGGAAIVIGIAAALALRGIASVTGPAAADEPAFTPAAQQMSYQPQFAHHRAARMEATIVTGASRFSAHEPIALPTGSSFQIELRADQSGHALVYAVSPTGETSRIWAGPVRPGDGARTSTLRLEGHRGMEHLRVVFSSDAGGAPIVRLLRVLHV